MRRTGKAAVVAAVVLGALGFGGAGVAHAEDLPLLDVVVRLDRTAPTTGELVRGVRAVEGYAEAPEGVTRVDLYVVEHSLTRPVTGSVPVASVTPSMPLGRAHFDFNWDSAKTPAGLVDVVVVATSTTTRTAEARVISVRVEHVAAQATKPVATKPSARKGSVKATAAKTTSRASGTAAVATRRTPARLAVSPAVGVAQEEQAAAFYSTYAGVEEAAVGAAAAPSPARALSAPVRTGRGVWPPVAVGLILLVAAGHAQRAVRVQLG